MLRDLTRLDLPDPMHLRPWEEKDEPLATDWHYDEQDRCFAALKARFAGPGCYVARDRWLLMDPANREDRLLPDLLVALGVPAAFRDEYDPAVEGKPPDLLAEYLSESSLKADLVEKPVRYAALGVREYWVFNLGGRFSGPRIRGWTLHQERAPEALLVAADGSVASRVLPVRFAVIEGQLEVLDAQSGALLTPLQEAQFQHRREAAARQAAEAEVARLRAELERLRREER